MNMGTTPLAYASWRATALGAVTEQLERSAVLELAGPLGGLDVLDVGCGDGTFALAAARVGAHVTAIDRSAPAVDAARDRATAEGVVVVCTLVTPSSCHFQRNGSTSCSQSRCCASWASRSGSRGNWLGSYARGEKARAG